MLDAYCVASLNCHCLEAALFHPTHTFSASIQHEAGHDTRPRVAYHRSASNRWRWGWLTPIKGA